MKIRYIAIIAVCLLLSACTQGGRDNIHGNAEIDWVDFLMLDGRSYTGLYETVIADPETVTDKKAGRTTFKVADVVTNPGYKIQNGDAAFLPIGTELYLVKGFKKDELIAARDSERIGGFRLYAEIEFAKTVQRHYTEIPRETITHIELYKGQETKPYKTLQGLEKSQLLQLLDGRRDVENYMPQSRDQDPAQYRVVFYSGGSLAYSYSLFDDGVQAYFSPDSTRLLDPAIRTLLQP